MIKGHAKCTIAGCHARAWHEDVCNSHALEKYRAQYGAGLGAEGRLLKGKRLLHQRAQELGIKLGSEGLGSGDEDMPVHVLVSARMRCRSPVA
jgi:hypothetical protein